MTPPTTRERRRSAADPRTFRQQFSANFNLALDRAGIPKAGQGRIARVSEMFKVSKATAQKWVSGTTLPEMYRFDGIAERLGCSVGQLYYGFDENGEVLSELDFISDGRRTSVTLSQDLVAKLHWPPNTFLLQVRDNTMEPYVIAGDLVIVDASVREVSNNAVYVLYHRGSYVVRRVQGLLRGQARMICDNKRYSPEDIPLQRASSADASPEDGSVYVVGVVIGRILLSR